MTRHIPRRFGIALAILLGAVPAVVGTAGQQGFKTEFFNGKVVPLASYLEKQGIKADADANGRALVTDDGKVYILVKDDGTRMFFKDNTLLDRPMRLTGRLVPNSTLLQAVAVHSYHKGQLHEVFYWCDTCAIRTLEPGDCACCSAKLELREVPVR
jgi:hypothetical protein